jgi:hypothetical protein
MRLDRLIAIAAVALLSLPGRGSAQLPQGPNGPPGPTARPAFPTYLNIVRGGSATLNYYGMVRPQTAAQQSLLSLQQQITSVQQREPAAGAGDSSLPITGQPAYFMNSGGYFLNQQVGPATAIRGGTLPTRTLAPVRPTTPGRTR